jgi:DNA-binding MarR family transcriptional regulator
MQCSGGDRRADKTVNNKAAYSAGESERTKIMATSPSTDHLVGILRDTVVALVRRDGPDLSARQLGVFLTCYLQDGAHTVRGLAADLNVSKPAITRALDRLGELDLARRKVDPMDRRSVLVQRTLKGTAFLRDLRGIMTEAANTAKKSGSGEASSSSRKVANG